MSTFGDLTNPDDTSDVGIINHLSSNCDCNPVYDQITTVGVQCVSRNCQLGKGIRMYTISTWCYWAPMRM